MMSKNVLKRVTNYIIAKRYSVAAVALFFCVASSLTWPFIAHPFSTQASAFYGDVMGSTSKFDALKNEGGNPFTTSQLKSIAYPDSIYSNVGVDRVSFLSTAFLWLLTLAVHSTFAHSMYVFLGYFISSCVIYAFIKRFTKSNLLGIVGGLTATSFPLFVSLARAAPVYMWVWLYILPIWAFIELSRNPSRRQVALTCLSILPGIFWTPYFLLHVSLIGLTCMTVYALLYFKNHKKLPVWHLLCFIGTFVATAIVYVLLGRSSSDASIPERSIADAYEQSLHPLMLMLPSGFTAWTTSIYDSVIKPLAPRSNETVLYAGIIVILLAIIGVITILKKRHYISNSVRLMGLYGGAVTLVTFLFSLAPTIAPFNFKIFTPNYLVVSLVPALRAGQRLVAPIMIGLVLLAIIGIIRLTHDKTPIKKVFIIISLVLFIAIDYIVVFEGLAYRTHQSQAMSVLAASPKGVVAQYFNDSLIGYPGQMACKNYMIHHQTMVNTCGLDVKTPPGEWPVIEAVARLDINHQLERLGSLGVRYIILDSTSPRMKQAVLRGGLTELTSDQRYTVYVLRHQGL